MEDDSRRGEHFRRHASRCWITNRCHFILCEAVRS